MPKTTTITLYEYHELSDKAKEKAREWWLEGQDDSCEISDYYRWALEYIGYPTDDVCFSLGCCQGDGMAFYGKVCFKEFFEKRFVKDTIPRLLLEPSDAEVLLKYKTELGEAIDYCYCTITRNGYGHHYSHHNTMSVSIDSQYDCDTNEEQVRLDNMVNELENWIQQDVRGISHALEKIGYDIIDSNRSEEVVADNIIANEYLFTEAGDRRVYVGHLEEVTT